MMPDRVALLRELVSRRTAPGRAVAAAMRLLVDATSEPAEGWTWNVDEVLAEDERRRRLDEPLRLFYHDGLLSLSNCPDRVSCTARVEYVDQHLHTGRRVTLDATLGRELGALAVVDALVTAARRPTMVLLLAPELGMRGAPCAVTAHRIHADAAFALQVQVELHEVVTAIIR